MPKQGLVSIALNVDYQKSLQQMTNDFNKALTQISNEAKKTNYTVDIEKQIGALKAEIKGFSDQFRSEFEKIKNQQIDSSNFKNLETQVTKNLEGIEKKFASVNTKIHGLKTQLGMLDGSDFASGMKKKFDDVTRSVLSTYKGLNQILDLSKSQPGAGIDAGITGASERAIKTLDFIRKIKAEINSASSVKMDANFDFMGGFLEKAELLERQIDAYRRLSQEIKNVPKSSPEHEIKENALIRIQAAAERTRAALLAIDDAYSKYNGGATLFDNEGMNLLKGASGFGANIDSFVSSMEKINQSTNVAKNSIKQTQETFNTFQIKDGAIHIPIDIATKSSDLKNRINEIVQELKKYADSNPVIAKVKLTLDGGSAKGYKTNGDIAKQLEAGQGEPAVDISKAIKKTYVQAVREAEKTAKDAIKAIQTIFDGSPVKITPNKEAFTSELSTMVNTSLGKIAESTTGLNVNSELEKLVANLKEVSVSLSGNGNFKFGLDEASIERINAAINNMANMIQRAFGVASDSDISAQWGVIESKFKTVAGEEGRLLKGNKEHKTAIQELAVEYKKYLDMGGKNDLSTLTSHKQTIKNIAAEYENLGKAAQEATQKQEQQAKKKPASTKVSSGEKEAINAVSRENKKLETQAGKTGTALDNEGKKAQSAAEKFRKLAKEKGAAVVANRELAKAAKETADALEREAKARKETGTRTGKSAVDSSVYATNAVNWQRDIKQSLMDSGDYEEVYAAQISRAESGVVKFAANVRVGEREWKKFVATVKSTGEISNPRLTDLTEKQVISIERAKDAWEKYVNAMAAGAEPTFLNRSELEEYIQTILRAEESLDKFKIKKVELGSGGRLAITTEFKEADGQIKTFVANFSSVDDIIDVTTGSVKNLSHALESAFDFGKMSSPIINFASKAQDVFNKFTLKHEGNSNWSQVANDVKRLGQSIAGINSQDGLDRFKQDLSDIAVKLNNIGKDNKLGNILGNNMTFKNINEVRANIDSLFASIGKVNQKSIRVSGTDRLTAEVKAANGEIHKMTVRLDSNGFARFVDNGIIQFGRLKEAVGGIFKGIFGYFRYYLSPYMLVSYTRRALEQVKEIDTAMTELRKVSDASAGAIDAYFDDAVISAKELGSSVKDMISATADWSRMGYNLPDSRELGEVAVLYKNVGDGIDIDTANESLVSTIQGFQLQAKDAMSVIDSFNEVSNNYAISSAGIGEALKRSAAAFNAANTDLNQSIALITAGNEIVQSPEKVGTMWQTVSARIRGTKTELEELGESTDDILSTSKLQSLVKGYTGVDIMEDKDTYKDIYTIVSEIGKVWKDLKDVERAALLEGLAGKKQSNTLAAVLNNAERLEEIYQTAEESSGSALKEQQRYTQSLQYSLDQLTATGEEFWYTFINKDDVKDFIDLINGLISGLTALVDTFGSIPSLAGIFAGFFSIKNNVGINMLVAYLSNLYCFELPTI